MEPSARRWSIHSPRSSSRFDLCNDLFAFEDLERQLQIVDPEPGYVLMLERNAIGQWRRAEETFIAQRNNDAQDDAIERKVGTFEPPPNPARCPDTIVERCTRVPMAEALEDAIARRRIATSEIPQ